MKKWNFLTMLAERKAQIRDDESYPTMMGYEYIKRTVPGQWGEKRSIVSYVQTAAKNQNITNKAFLTMWAEKYVAKKAYSDVIAHLRGIGQLTHELSKVDSRVIPSENFKIYSRVDCWTRGTSMPILVPYDDCDTIVLMRKRIDPEGEDWGDERASMCLIG